MGWPSAFDEWVNSDMIINYENKQDVNDKEKTKSM